MGLRNQLLSTLSFQDLNRIQPYLEEVPLIRKRVLHYPKLPIEHVYFVEDGLISIVANTDGENDSVEAWLIGHEGLAGVPVVLGANTSPHKRVVQVEGMALRMSAEDLRWAMDEMPDFRRLLLLYINSILVQVGQLAACNMKHTIQQRLARWLLMAHDRLGRDDLPLTHAIISKLLGVRRSSVTEKLAEFEAAQSIQCLRGHIRVLDRPQLEALACVCHRVIRSGHTAEVLSASRLRPRDALMESSVSAQLG